MTSLGKNHAGDTSLGGSGKDFPKTASDLLSKACHASLTDGRESLEELCRRYWKPVYFYLRIAWSKTNEDAKDLTQAFFLWLVEEGLLKRYEPERAAFRAYLKSLLKHFVQDHHKALHRLKRGGGARILNLDGEIAASGDALIDPKAIDPEKAFDHAWLSALLARAWDRVRDRLLSGGRAIQVQVFEEYNRCPGGASPTYASLAERLVIKEGDVKNHLFAVREELRKEIRSELSQTTWGPAKLEEEWNAFFGA